MGLERSIPGALAPNGASMFSIDSFMTFARVGQSRVDSVETKSELNTDGFDRSFPFPDLGGDKFPEMFPRSAFGGNQVTANLSEALSHCWHVHCGNGRIVKPSHD